MEPYGGPSRNRTDNLFITSEVLCQLSYRAIRQAENYSLPVGHKSQVISMCSTAKQFFNVQWRRRQDSNLHRVAPERFSRPWQYQLCLLLQKSGTYWCPQTLRFKCVKNCGNAASGGEGGIRTLARFYPPNPLAGGPLWPLGYLAILYKL